VATVLTRPLAPALAGAALVRSLTGSRSFRAIAAEIRIIGSRRACPPPGSNSVLTEQWMNDRVKAVIEAFKLLTPEEQARAPREPDARWKERSGNESAAADLGSER
jgi:hypothetical protein